MNKLNKIGDNGQPYITGLGGYLKDFLGFWKSSEKVLLQENRIGLWSEIPKKEVQTETTLTCLAIALLNIMWSIQVVLESFAYVKLLPVSEAIFQLGKWAKMYFLILWNGVLKSPIKMGNCLYYEI